MGLFGMRKNIGLLAGLLSLSATPLFANDCEEHWLIGDIRPSPGAQAELVAFKGGIVTSVGDASLLPATAPKACVEYLPDGAVAFAGFVDGHAHLLGIGLRELELNLEGTDSIEDLKRRLKEADEKLADGDTLYGRGWIETGWPEGRMPIKSDLDDVSTTRPIILTRADGHAAVVNSAALQGAGITMTTPNPVGGLIMRDDAGEANGLLIDRAENLVADLMPKLTPERRREALRVGALTYAHMGWTGLHNMSVDWEDVEILESFAAEGTLPLRVFNYVIPEATDNLIASGERCSDDLMACTVGVKFYADGALGSRGALLFEPYSDDPENTGLQLLFHDEAIEYFSSLAAAGLQVTTHAIGDRGNAFVLDLYEEIHESNPDRDHRWRVEHAQVLRGDDIERFAPLGVIASMQPSHAIGDLYFALDRLGTERLKGAYAWRTFLDTGAMVVGGSDAPVERGDVRIEIHAATKRSDLKGFQADHWHAEQAISPSEAMSLFTTNAAFAVKREDTLGKLDPGYQADITVFNVDPFAVNWEEVEVIATFVGGKRVEGQSK